MSIVAHLLWAKRLAILLSSHKSSAKQTIFIFADDANEAQRH